MMLVPSKSSKIAFRERVSRAIDAVRSFTLSNLLSSDRKTAELLGFGSRTNAGIVVTARNAFTFSAVFDAVNQGSSDVAKLPLNYLRRRTDGGSDHYTQSRTYRLLKEEPNPEMSSMEFRRTLQAHAMTLGGGYAEIERDGAGRPFWLWPITPDRVEERREKLTDGSDGPIFYRIDSKDDIPARDIIHIRGLGYDGLSGYNVIDKARQAIGLALAAEKFGATFFGEGAAFPGLLGLKAAVGPDALKALAANIREQDGRASWHKFLLLDNDPSFTSFGVEPQKAQMNELRTKQVEEVARFFNFPVHKLKNLDRATNNNIEQQDLEYYKGFMLNWTVSWEQELARKLVPANERGLVYFKHNFNAFLRADTVARTALYTALIDRGVFNADMVLELEDMNPQPNGLGKQYLVNSTMILKESVGTRVARQGAAVRVITDTTGVDAQITSLGEVAPVIAAHRALVVDTMRRMLDREIERARRSQATGAKLHEWLRTFYDGHQDLIRQALLPAVRIHLAWIGSTEDPGELALQLATAHVAESKRQVQTVLDGDAEDLAASIASLFHRWESERVTVIADVLMKRELERARDQ